MSKFKKDPAWYLSVKGENVPVIRSSALTGRDFLSGFQIHVSHSCIYTIEISSQKESQAEE